MAASLASDGRPSLPAPGDASNDPFVSSASNPTGDQRFSIFNHDLFAAGSGASPAQARRALEAHLAETDRRLDEAGKLGTALVSQRKALAEQLQEVDKLQAEGEMGPDLRKKLSEIEREYNDLARESARVFLPKQRVPSNEANPGSPYVPEGRSGRRSVSPSKFESQATSSPTKLSVPNRKIRNQPSNRVHDIEFAAEISTSLIAQVRNLQTLLSERDEELKNLQGDRTKLEIESENLQQRVKTLDESEHRYKEENWNLETRLQEASAQQKEAADREKKLTQALNLSYSEKSSTQKELDEVKLSHSKLAEEHAAAVKHHDIELGTAKRNMVMAEGERAAMQRKIDDLANQNQELAKAFSLQRGRATERDPASGLSDDDFETATDNITPEHSPPPSPIKGTPRHSMLETETIKTSLHHAQRTIQSQRSQLHREKTEKLEMRRIIQDLRDDLEKARGDLGGATSNRRSRKVDSKEIKKPQRLLGNFRSSRQEIVVDDPEWEDSPDKLPSAKPAPSQDVDAAHRTDTSDHFDTANEASESAFETANERATETEDFQTGNEGFSGSDDDARTETESLSRGFGRMRRPPSLPAGVARHNSRTSIDSTASTSADEDGFAEMRTPTATLSSQRSRLRLSRGPFSRSSRQASEEPNMRSSPASFASGGTPQPGQSLFAELQDFGGSGGSDDESFTGTPSRRSLRSVTPGSIRRTMTPPPAVPQLPKAIMVDAGVMTEPVKITPDVFVEEPPRPISMESVINVPMMRPSTAWRSSRGVDGDQSRPVSTLSYSDAGAQFDQDLEEKLTQFPMPPSSPPQMKLQGPPALGLSMIQSEHVEPREDIQPSPPALNLSSIQSEHVEPREDVQPSPPALGLSLIQSENVEPREELHIPPTPPTLRFTPLSMQHVEPLAEPEVPQPVLTLSAIAAQGLEPVAEPETPRPELTMTSVLAEVVDPVASPAPLLTLSTIAVESLEPKVEPAPEVLEAVPTPVVLPSLNMSAIMSENVEPVSETETIIPPPSLSLSSIHAEHLEPREKPEIISPPPTLAFSDIAAEQVDPVPEAKPLPPALAMSSLLVEQTQPIMELPPAPPALALSSIFAEHVEPVSPQLETPVAPIFGFSTIESIETTPMSPRSPRRDGFILPRDEHSAYGAKDQPQTPPSSRMNATVALRGRKRDSSPVIAEDETRQSPRDTPDAETPESQRPFKEISSNANDRAPRKQLVPTSDQGAQTALTSGAIDRLLMGGPQQASGHAKNVSLSPVGSPGTPGTVRVYRSQESLDSTLPGKVPDEAAFEPVPALRPGSAASGKASIADAPPLPSNHRQIIDAVRSGSSRGNMGGMPPPLWPASALKHRPSTPSQYRPASSASARATPGARAVRTGSAHGTAEIQSPSKLTARSRRSSVSSFVSELDTRFNIRPGEFGATGFGPNTDPRMIQAITQTMIGEFLWKYTRKTGRGELSENRHRRYFWVHPYTRTLYWSDRDPSAADRAELKAKSVPIEAVRVVTDDNINPPGLHRKSLVIISPGRTIKFTCTTGQRHETWFNALSYLLLRTNQEGQSDVEEVAENMTRDDVDEFNPQFGRRSANGNRPPAPPSLSSYNSRTTRNESPASGMSMNIPTLTPSTYKQSTATRPPMGTLGKLSGYWKSGAPRLSDTLSTLRGRGPVSQNLSIYEASEVHDSAEDLREMIERQDRESDRLENVRACCDGKHDVGTLHQVSKKGRAHHSHSHPGPSASNTPVASTRSRG